MNLFIKEYWKCIFFLFQLFTFKIKIDRQCTAAKETNRKALTRNEMKFKKI